MEAAQYDLIVVGAGPAGSACAITAARAGAKVLLLEKDQFPRQKVCGEFVSPESLGLLHGFLEDGRFRSCPQVVSSRIFLDNKTLVIPVSPAAQSIPRFDLDPALFAAAQRAGATAHEGVAVTEVQRDGVFHVRTSGSTYAARAVVNATGRWSKLTQFDVAGKDKWIGLKAHFTEPSPPQTVDLYFFSSGYCGVTPVGTKFSQCLRHGARRRGTHAGRCFCQRAATVPAKPSLAAIISTGNNFTALFPRTGNRIGRHVSGRRCGWLYRSVRRRRDFPGPAKRNARRAVHRSIFAWNLFAGAGTSAVSVGIPRTLCTCIPQCCPPARRIGCT